MTAVERSQAVVPSDQVLLRVVGGEAVLLDLASEEYFSLNEVGTRMWEAVSTNPSIDDALRALETEFDADPETLARDLERLVGELVDRGLVRLVAPPT